MITKIIKRSDIISLPGLAPARIGLAEQDKKYITFAIKVKDGVEEPIPSSIMPAPNMMVAQKQYTNRIRALEGNL